MDSYLGWIELSGVSMMIMGKTISPVDTIIDMKALGGIAEVSV